MTLRSKLKHAFAVDPPGPADPTPQQQAVIDRFCRLVARRRLAMPGLVVLEMARPLNWMAAQAMHFFSPGVWAVTPEQVNREYRLFARFLEQRGSVEYLVRRIEHFEQEYERKETERPARRTSAGHEHQQND